MPRKQTAPHATRGKCPRCDAPVLVQRDGLPFVVITDAEKLTPTDAAQQTGPNRLAWCLRESKWTGMRLVEVHHQQCAFPHVVDHKCPEGTPAVKGALW